MSIDGKAVESSNRYGGDGHDDRGFRLVRKSPWGDEVYKPSAEFADVVDSLPVLTCWSLYATGEMTWMISNGPSLLGASFLEG